MPPTAPSAHSLLTNSTKRDNNDAAGIAQVLWEIFSLLGPPKILQCDNAPQHTAAIGRALCRLLKIDERLITPYHPEANGKVESVIGKVKKMLAKELHGADSMWPFRLCFVQMAYNTRIAKLTNSTLFSLMFNREFNLIRELTQLPPTLVPTTLTLDLGRSSKRM